MNRKVRILIAEDDVLISESLRQLLQSESFEVVDIVSSTLDAKIALDKSGIDLAILDINMNGRLQGFEIAKYIQSEIGIPFIFLTSYSEEKIINKAAKFQPSGYLVKPYNQKTVISTVKLALANARNLTDKMVSFKQSQTVKKVALNDVLYVKADDVYIEIVTAEKTFLVRSSLKQFMQENNYPELIQTHRSYLANKRHITEYSSSVLKVKDTDIPISRGLSAQVKRELQ